MFKEQPIKIFKFLKGIDNVDDNIWFESNKNYTQNPVFKFFLKQFKTNQYGY